ncbi:MAG: toxin [Candidatus Raymondbacteria bacterium RifOxyA12_full_50_37]|uniref:Toxin n=1 Tax=Candidatus Raymondbacteria bacterium RIFOXYD12_FULL_49_13 TaxID=1817890 RepID=A0A1F7F4K4_UNCRA|nr:MAG: toxin [Candidatus Raymondbacteria bacterium RifOxyA12_full_50_37]OGJ86234.1 MAG: toxin [Candidatus Raymondbacteria bacterium RIFOXYA2_FULL_49_16]OGJ95773.1 MAG: toxin [Candidatus Raymondbacteria bacterium RIFOXYC2_FULL_50_21]OGK01467.1 MAG: toxin [Candidatus Raymondbacteria bacterium RIFOXYD12_FULL_49_13]OGK03463.1 MAG: toxin [Candidatus Raymondbacteria bacterium RifOxyB12_full_50_8]OGK04723.1 MAG: toxin [Candidatus Raymondbacteria bacterium RifOxyC12_full_50_8]OGP42686.1 MAG: toxin [
MDIEFTYDPAKSDANKTKHGIDFEEAKALWADPDRIEIPAKTVDEPRGMVIGKIEAKIWSSIITVREGKTRIISVRRSRKNEEDLYESKDI